MKTRWISLLLSLCLLLALVPAAHAAQIADSGTCGDYVTWTLDSDGLLTIGGADYMPHYKWNESPFYGNAAIRSVSFDTRFIWIGNSLFSGCSGLTSVTIPKNVSSIGSQAFSNCTGLKSIFIPVKVTSIRTSAFSGCGSLTDVYFSGTAEQWEAINIESGNDALTNAALHPLETVASGACGEGVSWTLDSDGLLTITGKGAMTDCSASTAPWGRWNDQISRVAVKYGVTRIGNYAFSGCRNLADLELTMSIASVGDRAFSGCDALEKIYYDAGEYQWGDISDAVLCDLHHTPEIHCMGEVQAHGDCGNDAEWELTYDGVFTVFGAGPMAEYNDNYSGSERPWKKLADQIKTVVIQPGITSVGGYSFSNCTNLTDVSLPEGIISIGKSAFSSCKALRVIEPQAGLREIRDSAFNYCENLEHITLPEGLRSIGKSVFDTCRKLSDVVLPESLVSLGDYAFDLCGYELKFIRIPPSVTEIGAYVFSNCYGLETAELPDNLTTVRNSMFNNCDSLKEITIPDSVTAIEDWAFSWCRHLTAITVPCNVTSIGYCAFNQCDSLTEICLPAALRSVGNKAFQNCTVLKDVYFAGTEEQWNKISVGSDNDPLRNAEIHFIESSPLRITAQPQDASGTVGQKLVYTITAEGDDLTYQWQYSKDGGRTWLASSSKTTAATCTLAANRDGWLYRCIITDSDGNSVTSDVAAVKVLPAITAQPRSASGVLWEKLRFTVAATGPNLAYQWQYSEDGGKTWKASSSKTTTATCTLLSAARDGWLYRCIITAGNGETVMTETATVTILPAITVQPRDASGAVGQKVQYTIAATGVGLTYQWQYSTDGGRTWKLSSSKTTTATCTLASNRDGWLYRCVVTDGHGKTVTSDTARVTVRTGPVITAQPQPASGKVGEKVHFTIAATGDGLTYQWQYSEDGGKTWKASSSKTTTATCTLASNRDGWLYRCIVTDAYGGAVTSNTARVTVQN